MKLFISILSGIFILLYGDYFAWAETLEKSLQGETRPAENKKELILADSAMCEEIREYAPYNRAVIFSTSLGKAVCYTFFEPVPEKTVIYHHWFRRDVLSTSIKLELQPPRWATYSTIQLREADKGPWRVEITHADGKIIKTLRFSIVD